MAFVNIYIFVAHNISQPVWSSMPNLQFQFRYLLTVGKEVRKNARYISSVFRKLCLLSQKKAEYGANTTSFLNIGDTH